MSKQSTENLLYYGDNLEILRRYISDSSIDLVYLDPPFNSQQDYNILFKERDGTDAAAQIKAFEDTWRWDRGAELAYQEIVEAGGRLSQAIQGLRMALGSNDMMAYLAMMAPRLAELRRVLKSSGSIYLHCDTTSSHYLKVLMDAVFGPQNFRNEICWKRTSAHNDPKRYGRVHDIILYYTVNMKEAYFRPVFVDYDDEYLKSEFRLDSKGRMYKLEDLTAPSHGGKSGRFSFHGRVPSPSRMWRLSKDEMEKLLKAGRIKTDAKGTPLLRGHVVYLDEKRGMPVQDWWGDVLRVGNTASERLGYPTQKPEALLQRILLASSKPGDTVLDPFCGCGTTISVAHRLKRRWIGIDITYLAIALIKSRIRDAYGGRAKYRIVGEPVSLPDAHTLAGQDRYQFQWWALGLAGARPVEQKRGADKGIDGRIYFHDENGTKTKQVIFSVKSGQLKATDVRDLRGVVEREKAAIGVLIALNPPTKAMRTEAAAAGFYDSPGWNRKYPKIQILTVQDLLDGKVVQFPPSSDTFKRAPKSEARDVENGQLFATDSEPDEAV